MVRCDLVVGEFYRKLVSGVRLIKSISSGTSGNERVKSKYLNPFIFLRRMIRKSLTVTSTVSTCIHISEKRISFSMKS